MTFIEFESALLDALPKLRSELEGLQGRVEAQLSAWLEHLFKDYLGYSWDDFVRGEGAQIGAKGSKQIFPDLRIDIRDTGLIFIECKRLGLLTGPKGPDELKNGLSQLWSYIQAHLFRLSMKPKTVLGVVSDGNRWHLVGLDKLNKPHTIAEWAFLTDDPRLIAKCLWLLAKPALAQPTSGLVEFLARRTLAEVLKEMTKRITQKVNEKLPDGVVSPELIGKWLREALADSTVPSRLVPVEATAPSKPPPPPAVPNPGGELPTQIATTGRLGQGGVTLIDLIAAGVLSPPFKLFRKYKGQTVEADLRPDGQVVFQGVAYASCSTAGEVARASVTGQRMHTNGWTFWQYRDAAGKRLCLDDARKRYGKPAKARATGGPERYDIRKRFWQALLSRPNAKGTRHENIAPSKFSWIGAGSGVQGCPFTYSIGKNEGRVELYIDRGAGKQAENKDIFDRLHKHKAEIEKAFGGELSWQRLNDKQGCRVACETTGGYKSDEAQWPTLQDAMIVAMGRLEQAIAPHLAKLKSEGV
jgi:hypothetical protein